jgi:hypothetical protein
MDADEPLVLGAITAKQRHLLAEIIDEYESDLRERCEIIPMEEYEGLMKHADEVTELRTALGL